MNALIIGMRKGQRLDLTAQVKDTDSILDTFRENSVRFDKKYTTISETGPSTITFKGIRSSTTQDKLADVLMKLHGMARDNKIGNVYIKFVSLRPKMTSLVAGNGNDRQELLVKQHIPEEKRALATEIKNRPEVDDEMDFNPEIDMPDDTL